MRKRNLLLLLTVLCVSVNAQTTTLKKLVDNVSEGSLKANLYKIAGNEFEGRMAATKGDKLAIKFIASWFAANHLINPYTSTPFLQSLPLTYNDYSKSSFSVDGKSFQLDKQWTYLNGCNSFEYSSVEIVFIGYGISVPSYDELKDIDIKDKFVILQQGFPTNNMGENIIPEKEMPNQGQRMMGILAKKPKCVLVYSPQYKNVMKDITDFRTFKPFYIYTKEAFPPVDVIMISPEITNYLVGNIDSINNLINITGKPQAFNTHKKATVSIYKNEKKTNTENIVGLIKGTEDKLPCIVCTAHHDHEGKVNDSTYYGADDNASGTTALLEIAKIFGNAANRGIRPKRTIVFVSTAAEEQESIGARYYVDHPAIPLSNTYCNINIDMIGRVDSFYTGRKVDSNYIYCIFQDTTNKIFNSEKLSGINNVYSNLILDTLYASHSKTLDPFGLMARSDNFPFMQKGIPSILFFSGFHKDYHQPSDTPDKINYPLFKCRTQFALAALWQIANE